MILMNNVKTFYLVITCLCLIGMEKPSEMCVSSFMSGACQFLCSWALHSLSSKDNITKHPWLEIEIDNMAEYTLRVETP